MNGLIVEGVTGVGKTSVISELEKTHRFERFDEDATFDDFMGDLERDRNDARRRANERMERILDAIASFDAASNVLLERFHFSHVALDDDWEAYDEIDRRCSALGLKVVVLTIPEDRISSRSLYRAEHDGRDWQGFAARYGSEAPALDALKSSQCRRIGALRHSRLERLLVETTDLQWPIYAPQIADWAGWSR